MILGYEPSLYYASLVSPDRPQIKYNSNSNTKRICIPSSQCKFWHPYHLHHASLWFPQKDNTIHPCQPLSTFPWKRYDFPCIHITKVHNKDVTPYAPSRKWIPMHKLTYIPHTMSACVNLPMWKYNIPCILITTVMIKMSRLIHLRKWVPMHKYISDPLLISIPNTPMLKTYTILYIKVLDGNNHPTIALPK